MNSLTAQSDPAIIAIVQAYEQDGLTLEQIIEAFSEYDPTAIKQILINHSKSYKRDAKFLEKKVSEGVLVDNPYFNADDTAVARQVILEIATQSEVDAVKLKAAKLILDEAKGRNDVKPANHINAPKVQFNIQMLQEHATKARKAIERSRGIDVDTVVIDEAKAQEAKDAVLNPDILRPCIS